MKKISLDNLFIFLIILWKYDEWRKACFRVLRCRGVFLARLIVTWIHFLVNELQECDSIDRRLWHLFHSFFNNLFLIHSWCRNRLGLGANSWPSPNSVCLWIYKCFLRDSTFVSFSHKTFIYISCSGKYVRSLQGGWLIPNAEHCCIVFSLSLSPLRFVRNRSAKKKFFLWPWTIWTDF